MLPNLDLSANTQRYIWLVQAGPTWLVGRTGGNPPNSVITIVFVNTDQTLQKSIDEWNVYKEIHTMTEVLPSVM